jgi:DNA-binding HxlR family transcriptional regulator
VEPNAGSVGWSEQAILEFLRASCAQGVPRHTSLRRLPARELGIGRNILMRRLNKLVDEGIMHRVEYQDKPPRSEYRLTQQGREVYPIHAAMAAWGERWRSGPEGTPRVLHHATCDLAVHDRTARLGLRPPPLLVPDGSGPRGLNYAIDRMPDKEERIVARRLEEHAPDNRMCRRSRPDGGHRATEDSADEPRRMPRLARPEPRHGTRARRAAGGGEAGGGHRAGPVTR